LNCGIRAQDHQITGMHLYQYTITIYEIRIFKKNKRLIKQKLA
jgi:hypothetical protein